LKRCPKCYRTFDNKEMVCPFDNIPLAETGDDLFIGSVLDKRYRVLEKIGEGGMGKVYKVEHIVLGKIFALKALNYELAQREDSIKRFINEAKITSRIGHPNIIGITDFGRTPDGSFYFVMEYVNGKTLYDLLNQNKTITPSKCVEILSQCTDALYAAHKEGIVHRDLKPDNIMLTDKSDGSYFVKILDFGISKITGNHNTRLTSSGVIIGTPEYMSPEQASQEAVDHRTDIYSLGVIMYQMLTGNLPFTSSNPINLLMMHKTKSPKPLKTFNPSVPSNFENICLKCLAKNPADRFQDMKELKDTLHNAINSKDVDFTVSSLDLKNNILSSDEGYDMPPPSDISLEKIHEVRSKLFADSNSVWFDPYSKPQAEKKEEIQIENNKKPDSIIIDTSSIEKDESIQLDKSKITNTNNEELVLVTEVQKPKSPIPKIKVAVKEKESAIKKRSYDNVEEIFTKKNILIGISAIIIAGVVFGLIIYKSALSGLDTEIKKEIQFNTPLPVNPTSVKDEDIKETAEKRELSATSSESENKTKKRKSLSSRAEKPQVQKSEKSKNAYDYFKEANDYFKKGKYDMAAEYYKSALRLKPDFAIAYRGLGACYAMMGKADISIKQYEKYIELDPNGPDVDKVIKIINEYRSKNK